MIQSLTEESDPIVAWMIAEAADSINRYQIGVDGKTRRQRVTGKSWLRQVAECGECVYYLKLKTKGIHTWEERWAEGIRLGVREESGEILIGTDEGVVKARTWNKKATEEERWDVNKLKEFRGTPWEPEPGGENIEIGIKVRLPREEENFIERPESEGRRFVKKRMFITKDIIDRYKMTPNCRGCRAVNRGAA